VGQHGRDRGSEAWVAVVAVRIEIVKVFVQLMIMSNHETGNVSESGLNLVCGLLQAG
jgi:hypothetical protein